MAEPSETTKEQERLRDAIMERVKASGIPHFLATDGHLSLAPRDGQERTKLVTLENKLRREGYRFDTGWDFADDHPEGNRDWMLDWSLQKTEQGVYAYDGEDGQEDR